MQGTSYLFPFISQDVFFLQFAMFPQASTASQPFPDYTLFEIKRMVKNVRSAMLCHFFKKRKSELMYLLFMA
jgi:hypothetical protein